MFYLFLQVVTIVNQSMILKNTAEVWGNYLDESSKKQSKS